MLPSLNWRHISVVKAMGLAVLITICGYTASLVTMIQAIQSLSPLVYDYEIEDALEEELIRIKNQDRLQRRLLVHLLREEFQDGGTISESEIKNFLASVDLPDSSLLGMIQVRQAEPTTQIDWKNPVTLQVLNLEIHMPLTSVKKRFNNVRILKQRYQLIRGTWEDQIGPTFIAVHGIILLTTFALLGGALFVVVQRYRQRIRLLISGFGQWSESDPQFRFKAKDFKDELALISQQFNIMADEVETNRKKTLYLEKMSSWQTMAKKMAHEIKNPLTPIKMMVSHLVRKYDGNDPSYQKILDDSQQIIVEEVNSLRRMVDSFSKFAQLPEPSFEDYDLVILCQHVSDLQKAAYPQHTLTFTSSLTEAIAHVDPQLLRQVILNISKNAAEASESCAIEFQLLQTERYFSVKIIDDGPGIPADYLQRIFEAYFTTKHTGSSPGMGLGLAICKKIVLDHGGELLVESRPGRTCFTITIPNKVLHKPLTKEEV